MSRLPLQPLDIAREALRQLASRRIPPTPDNFRALYHEISGTVAEAPFPSAELRRITASLPRDTSERAHLAAQLDNAVESGEWNTVQTAMQACLTTLPDVPRAWGSLLRELMGQIDLPHKRLTRARKLAALEHVLSSTSGNADMLFARLKGMVQGWQREPLGDTLAELEATAGQPQAADAERSAPHGMPPAETLADDSTFAQWLVVLLRRGVLPLLADNAALAEEAAQLADSIESSARGNSPGDDIVSRLNSFGSRLEWAGEDQRAIRGSLLNLLRLIIDNISELVIDDQWLHGQVEALCRMFDSTLDIRALDDLERRLRDVIDKQKHLKRQLTDAQERLKSMLVGFVDRLAGLNRSTGDYHRTLSECASRIRTADDVGQLGDVVERLLSETRAVQQTAERSSAEIGALREQVEAANSLITRLQRELDETSELVRYDPLTGVLNRKGLDEALEREIARARRHSSVICVGLLDLDNFKQLNDTFGHRTGDEALRHLTQVARGSLRQEDIIGRLGGEEFLMLLPDADEAQATQIMTRLQRALTTHIFLADNSRVLITFSAGIARIGPESSARDAIDRADKAMYAAKRAGKNRVLVAG
jgi:diguanylate cyclase